MPRSAKQSKGVDELFSRKKTADRGGPSHDFGGADEIYARHAPPPTAPAARLGSKGIIPRKGATTYAPGNLRGSKGIIPRRAAAYGGEKTDHELDREIEQIMEVGPAADTLTTVMQGISQLPNSARAGRGMIYISELWKQVAPEIEMSLPQFKRWLLDRQIEGTFTLKRADLATAYDPHKIKQSHIDDMGATFHFVVA